MEKLHEPLASTHRFLSRLAKSIVLGLFLIFIALLIGMIGYHRFEGMPWVDAFVNAAMILSGMGPMGTLNTSAGKIFAGFYALFSGLVFIAVIGIVFAPVIHRFLHKLSTEEKAKSRRR